MRWVRAGLPSGGERRLKRGRGAGRRLTCMLLPRASRGHGSAVLTCPASRRGDGTREPPEMPARAWARALPAAAPMPGGPWPRGRAGRTRAANHGHLAAWVACSMSRRHAWCRRTCGALSGTTTSRGHPGRRGQPSGRGLTGWPHRERGHAACALQRAAEAMGEHQGAVSRGVAGVQVARRGAKPLLGATLRHVPPMAVRSTTPPTGDRDRGPSHSNHVGRHHSGPGRLDATITPGFNLRWLAE
jgi:hypothetical protein